MHLMSEGARVLAAVVLAAGVAHAQASSWPAPHAGAHGVAYDSRRGMTMVYGDRGPDSTTLWGWDGAKWRAFREPGPGLRRHIKLAYDPVRDRLVMYGGFIDNATYSLMADTWEWDGSRWERVATDGPGPRASYSLVYDPARQRVVMFGGLSKDSTYGDTWSWDGRRWAKLADTGPSRRFEAGLSFDAATQRASWRAARRE